MHALKLQTVPVEEELFSIYAEYKHLTGGNVLIQAAIDATHHRYNAKKKHATYHEAKGLAEFALYREYSHGHSMHSTIDKMIEVCDRAYGKTADKDAKNHIKRKRQLLSGILNCLEVIYKD